MYMNKEITECYVYEGKQKGTTLNLYKMYISYINNGVENIFASFIVKPNKITNDQKSEVLKELITQLIK